MSVLLTLAIRNTIKMGGKVWTEKEEKMFWLNIVPQSPKRAGADKVNPEKSWKDLALEMQARLANNAQRKYTALMLCESRSHLHLASVLFPTR